MSQALAENYSIGFLPVNHQLLKRWRLPGLLISN